MAKRVKGWAGCFSLPVPPAKPIFALSEMDFLRTEDRSCFSAPPNTPRSPVCVFVCLSSHWSIVQAVVPTCTARGQTWDYTVGGSATMSRSLPLCVSQPGTD